MAIAEHRMNKNQRFYPCPKCHLEHPSISTLLGVIGSGALMGWMAKNGTAKLNVFADVVKENVGNDSFALLAKGAEGRWKLTEDTAFWKSGKETGSDAADIGTVCHAWIEAHLQGRWIELAALPEKGRNAVDEYLKWEKEHQLETVKTEQTFYNCKLNYAGTADWVGKLDGELSVGDWKTSTGIFFNYVVQGWGYALADETQNADRLYRQIFIGRFGKDGSSDVKIFKRNEFPSIETARDVLIACGHIFAAQNQWEETFPFVKKEKKEQPIKKGEK